MLNRTLLTPSSVHSFPAALPAAFPAAFPAARKQASRPSVIEWRILITCLTLYLSLMLGSCASDAGNAKKTNAKKDSQAGSIREASSYPRVLVGPIFLLAGGEEAKAVVVNDAGTILAVHRTLEEAPRERRVTLPGTLAVAGLHDAHLHLAAIGHAQDRADLRGSTSASEVVKRLQGFTQAREKGAFLEGRGWDQTLFPEQAFPSAGDLALLGSGPVVLSRVDGHAIWVNQAALDLAGINVDTQAPEGGVILRDDEGEPTGIFIDNAMTLIRSKLPAPTDADLDRWLTRGLQACADAGLVAVHDMGMSLRVYRRLQKLEANHQVPLRVFVYLDGTDAEALSVLKASLAASLAANKPSLAPAANVPSRRVHLMGHKLYADGAMGSRGAAFLADYSDDKGNRGLLLTEPSLLNERVRAVHQAGGQVAIHAIGDRGVRTALAAIEAAQRVEEDAEEVGEKDGNSARRHRIEHAQLVSPDDFATFQRLGVTASMQPTHATSDMRWAEDRVGPGRIRGTYAWQTMLQNEVALAFGSDAPVESHRPAWGIYAAVTRQDHQASPPGGWWPDQRLNLNQALATFSAGAAFAVHAEKSLGMIAEGAQCDLTIWPMDPRGSPARWLSLSPVATVVAGALRPRGKELEVKR